MIYVGEGFAYVLCRQILYHLSHQGKPIPSPGDLPDPGIEPGSPALQADSLPAELSLPAS